MQNSAAQPFSATVREHAGSVPRHSGKVVYILLMLHRLLAISSKSSSEQQHCEFACAQKRRCDLPQENLRVSQSLGDVP